MGHANRVWSSAFVPVGRLFSCAEDRHGIVWDLAIRQPVKQFDSLFDVSASVDGRKIVSIPGSQDTGEICLWQILNAYSLEPEFTVSRHNEIFCAALSPDGNYQCASVWSRQSRSCLRWSR